MEQWDILDKNGLPTGKTVKRKRICLLKGEYHLVVHIWILGMDGRILIQRRSFSKPLMPGEWAAIGGSVVSGESSIDAAKRELLEEMGISVMPDKLHYVRQMIRKNSILDIYLVEDDTPASELNLQESEVADAKWVHRNKLRQMIKNGEFHNYGKEYFDVVFDSFCRSTARKRRKKHERKSRK